MPPTEQHPVASVVPGPIPTRWRWRALAVMMLGAVALTGCFTGERPTLAEAAVLGAPVGDPASDAVLTRFAELPDATFTARYEITNNFGPITRDATVVQTADGRRSITIGEVRFILEPGRSLTCRLDRDEPCDTQIDDAAVSDLQVTHQFYGRSASDRLRIDAERRVAPTEGYDASFAGVEARCVTVPVSGGSKAYCALPEGVLASYQGPDVLVVLTGFEPAADESAFDQQR